MTDLLALGLGPDGPGARQMVLSVGPAPSPAQGPLELRLATDGERVLGCEPVVGYMHRGVEKLAEVRDYRQIMALANRHEWLSAFPSEVGVGLLVEEALGITPPERATWIRTMLVEVNRVLAHLVHLAAGIAGLGLQEGLDVAFAAREELQHPVEELTGGRMHLAYAVVGGVHHDLPEGWTDRMRAGLAEVPAALDRLAVLLSRCRHRLRGLGVVAPEMVAGYGLTGPVARASGVGEDLRALAPSLAYGEVFTPADQVTRTEGDAFARYEVLVEEARVSLRLAQACLERLDEMPPGPVDVRLPKVLRVPEGEYYAVLEQPLGHGGYYLASRGEKYPWRFAMRTASFNHASALGRLVEGVDLEDVAPLVTSLLLVAGDLDR